MTEQITVEAEWEYVETVRRWERRRVLDVVVDASQDTPMDVVRAVRHMLPTENDTVALAVDSNFGTFYLVVTHRSENGMTVHEQVHDEKYVLGPTPPTSPASAV